MQNFGMGGFGGVDMDAYNDAPANCGCEAIGYEELVQFLVDNTHATSRQNVADRMLKKWKVVKR